MLGTIWYRTKVLRVLRDDLSYNPAVPGLQGPAFNACTKMIRSIGGNEYDGAIAFMLVQLGCLTGADEQARTFIHDKLTLIRRLYPQAPLGESLVSDYNITREQLAAVGA